MFVVCIGSMCSSKGARGAWRCERGGRTRREGATRRRAGLWACIWAAFARRVPRPPLFLGGRGADLVVFDEDAVGLGAVDEGVEELLGVGDVAFEVVEAESHLT